VVHFRLACIEKKDILTITGTAVAQAPRHITPEHFVVNGSNVASDDLLIVIGVPELEAMLVSCLEACKCLPTGVCLRQRVANTSQKIIESDLVRSSLIHCIDIVQVDIKFGEQTA
jgi:hypothetical protein